MMANDTIDVFVLKAPVWEFKFGDLLKHFVSGHWFVCILWHEVRGQSQSDCIKIIIAVKDRSLVGIVY